jgi:hypothetical protein
MELRLLPGEAARGPAIGAGIVVGSLAVLALTVSTNSSIPIAVPLITLVVVFAVGYRTLLAWQSLLLILLAVILLVPIRRYTLGSALPFQLEPYRLLIAFIVAGWLVSLLVDPRVRLRRSGFEGPLALAALATFGSDLANMSRFEALSSYVLKSLSFFASFLLVFYFVVSVTRTTRQVERLLAALTAGGAILGIFALIESRTNYNAFDHLASVVPVLHPDTSIAPSLLEPRGGRFCSRSPSTSRTRSAANSGGSS